MLTHFHGLFFLVLFLSHAAFASETLEISHGPMLGAVSEKTAAIWVRTTIPGNVSINLSIINQSAPKWTQQLKSSIEQDNSIIFRFESLPGDTEYKYEVQAGESIQQGTFTTLGPSVKDKVVRMVYGYGYKPHQSKLAPDTSVFIAMKKRQPNLLLFLGDFPYTVSGSKSELRAGHQVLRNIKGFRKLTSSIPTYAIYDDHDFGPNNTDGTHENADEALAVFKEFWPNPSYGLPDNKGIYCSFIVGNVEFFLLDGRYHSNKDLNTMLGPVQFDWLCNKLLESKSRYKILVSGTQFGRVKTDSWGGWNYKEERNKLFDFIYANNISGVIGISGDVHRSDISKFPIGGDRFFYDFTPGALARKQRVPPDPMPKEMIHSYSGKDDNNMFGEIEFYPASEKDVAILYRSFSAINGLIYEYKLSPEDLIIQSH